MTNEQKYTTLTQSQRLKEIGFDAEADGYWYQETLVKYENGKSFVSGIHSPLFLKTRDDYTVFETKDNEGKTVDTVPSYRLDTLLLALPEWCVRARQCLYDFKGQTVPRETEIKLVNIGMLKFFTPLRVSAIEVGEKAIAAAVDLIVLLKEVE